MFPVKRIWIALAITALVVATEADVTLKRVPSGFLGMRGKKSMDVAPYDENFLQQIEYDKLPYLNDNSRFTDQQSDMFYGYSLKRAPMGFQGMRGKKDYLMDTGPLPHEMADSFYNEDTFEKRGPLGFQGMRGKREFEYPILAYPNKRGPLGFQGMRGKKSNDLSDEYLHTFDGENSNDKNLNSGAVKSDKIDAVSAEQGPDTEASDSLISVKQRRAQNIGFYGVRGKKMPSSMTFFGMRGKKGPFDFPFRGKFVGVRGKKMSNDRPSELQMLAERLAWNDDGFAKRRGPSGFVGMRGKKWIAPDGDLSQAMSASNDNEEE